MRISFYMMTMVMLLVCGLQAQQQTVGDTMYVQPSEDNDLTDAVASWLESRNFVIPLPIPEYKIKCDNTVKGVFVDGINEDIAVLTVPGTALKDSCRLFVFPKGDTLQPMHVASQKFNFYAGSHWGYNPHLQNDNNFYYGWGISVLSVKEMKSLKSCEEQYKLLPEIKYQGIHLWITDKIGGWYYYYDGINWYYFICGC